MMIKFGKKKKEKKRKITMAAVGQQIISITSRLFSTLNVVENSGNNDGNEIYLPYLSARDSKSIQKHPCVSSLLHRVSINNY